MRNLWAIALLCFVASSAFADEERPFTGPFLLRNDSPIYLTLFSTAMPERAKTVAARRWAWEAGYSNSNNIVDQNNLAVTDRVIVDGELQRFEVNVRYGLAEHWELAAYVPYLYFGGGYMDDFIDSFEDNFSLTTPRARRIRDTGELRYLFRVNGQNVIDETNEAIHGLGDIPVQLKWRFRDEPDRWFPQMAVRGMLKFPSATDPHLGNDRLDGGIGLLAEQPIGTRWLILMNLDVTSAHLPLALKTVDIDPVVVSGLLGLEYFITDRASLKAQMAIGSNPYPKFAQDMTALNREPIGLAIGWTYRLLPKASVKLAAAENVNSAWPDFGWTASFQGEF